MLQILNQVERHSAKVRQPNRPIGMASTSEWHGKRTSVLQTGAPDPHTGQIRSTVLNTLYADGHAIASIANWVAAIAGGLFRTNKIEFMWSATSEILPLCFVWNWTKLEGLGMKPQVQCVNDLFVSYSINGQTDALSEGTKKVLINPLPTIRIRNHVLMYNA